MARLIFVNRFFAPDHSATSQLLTDLSRYLAQQGQTVHIITSRQRYEGGAPLVAYEQVDGVEVHRVFGFRFGRRHLLGRGLDYLSFYLFAAWKLLWLAGRHDCVVAKTDPPLISVIVTLVSFLKGFRVINWVQDLFPEVAVYLLPKLPWSGLQTPLQWIRNASLKHAYSNVVISKAMKQRLQQEGVASSKLHLIYNWSITPVIDVADDQPNPYREQWALEHRFVLAYSGNMGRAHLFDALAEVVEKTAGQTRIQWLFIGGGPKREALFQRLSDLQGDTVQFQPYQSQENLNQTLKVADLHLVSLTPEMEGLIFPSKLCGILQAGRGVIFIGDPKSEMAQLILAYQCGLVFHPNDAENLYRAVVELSQDIDLCEEMGRRALVLSQELFAREEMLKTWESLISIK
ncbi:glycosyltransferase family 4 protein [Magnetococcus sp. PR-3]|uniref:glycosyltransferase family 4 protein n=1 Tax=Magnetococcus sp. PR-3 TaxID=3120355 RepID=UPI002FCE0D45